MISDPSPAPHWVSISDPLFIRSSSYRRALYLTVSEKILLSGRRRRMRRLLGGGKRSFATSGEVEDPEWKLILIMVRSASRLKSGTVLEPNFPRSAKHSRSPEDTRVDGIWKLG